MEPRPDLIVNQSEDWTKHMVLAKARDRELAVGYFPDNKSIQVDLSGFPATVPARWFNPISGKFENAQMPSSSGVTRSFDRPSGWEGALLVLGKPLR